MSQKKSSTARKSAASKPPQAVVRAELRKKLARDIVSIFNNPECPACIGNALSEGTSDLFNSVTTNSREASETYYLALLDALANQEKGGAQ
jgi:hypothetical protein